MKRKPAPLRGSKSMVQYAAESWRLLLVDMKKSSPGMMLPAWGDLSAQSQQELVSAYGRAYRALKVVIDREAMMKVSAVEATLSVVAAALEPQS